MPERSRQAPSGTIPPQPELDMEEAFKVGAGSSTEFVCLASSQVLSGTGLDFGMTAARSPLEADTWTAADAKIEGPPAPLEHGLVGRCRRLQAACL